MRPIRRFPIVSIASLILILWTATVAPTPIASASLPNLAITRTANTYYFTMTLPEHSAAFAKLSLTEQHQEEQAAPTQFELPLTEAFSGTPSAMGRPIAIAASVDETGTVWVEFDRAIPARTTLTVAFKGRSTLTGGSYHYGVAAYPNVATPVAVFVGDDRLTVR